MGTRKRRANGLRQPHGRPRVYQDRRHHLNQRIDGTQSTDHRPITSLGQFVRAEIKRGPSMYGRFFDGGHNCIPQAEDQFHFELYCIANF
jgi:hypothetical protein